MPIILLCGCEKTATVSAVEVFPFSADFTVSEIDLFGSIFMESENDFTAGIIDCKEKYTVCIRDDTMTIECNEKQYTVNAEIYADSPLMKIKSILTDINGKDAQNGEYKSNNDELKYTVILKENKIQTIYTDDYTVEF